MLLVDRSVARVVLVQLVGWVFLEVLADGGRDNGREGDGSVSLRLHETGLEARDHCCCCCC